MCLHVCAKKFMVQKGNTALHVLAESKGWLAYKVVRGTEENTTRVLLKAMASKRRGGRGTRGT